MSAPQSIIGAILVGGRSARMGAPKHNLTMPDGRPMLDCVHHALAAVCARVVTLGDTLVRPDLTAIPDRRPGLGPLAGIEALLNSGLADQYLIAPCDVPMLTAATCRVLLDDAVALVTHFEDHPLPLRIRADAAPIVTAMLDGPGPHSVRAAAAALNARVMPLPDRCRDDLMNINTPDHLAAARRARPGTAQHPPKTPRTQ